MRLFDGFVYDLCDIVEGLVFVQGIGKAAILQLVAVFVVSEVIADRIINVDCFGISDKKKMPNRFKIKNYLFEFR